MRAPSFWYHPSGLGGWLWPRLLAPLGALYAFGTARRLAKGSPKRVGVPVICVGNLEAGGTGKTPAVIALQQRLADRGVIAHVVSRGYGGRLQGPVQVDARQHHAEDVGDEPLLMAAFGPVWVAKDRAAVARQAVEAGAQVILLDDGFQNPALQKDLSLVVVDARRGFGNGRVIPAGPLREPIDIGLQRADFVLSIGTETDQAGFRVKTTPRLKGTLKPLQTGVAWSGLPVFAFAGIGNPAKFFRSLKDLGADIRGTVSLADHQPLTPSLLKRLSSEAKKHQAQLVTTEKDAARLPQEMRGRVLSLPVRLELDDWGPLDAAIDQLLGR